MALARSRSSANSTAGFSLVEVLIATLLLAMALDARPALRAVDAIEHRRAQHHVHRGACPAETRRASLVDVGVRYAGPAGQRHHHEYRRLAGDTDGWHRPGPFAFRDTRCEHERLRRLHRAVRRQAWWWRECSGGDRLRAALVGRAPAIESEQHARSPSTRLP